MEPALLVIVAIAVLFLIYDISSRSPLDHISPTTPPRIMRPSRAPYMEVTPRPGMEATVQPLSMTVPQDASKTLTMPPFTTTVVKETVPPLSKTVVENGLDIYAQVGSSGRIIDPSFAGKYNDLKPTYFDSSVAYSYPTEEIIPPDQLFTISPSIERPFQS
jgi:hypothetical protein